jgi:hypothetical protein
MIRVLTIIAIGAVTLVDSQAIAAGAITSSTMSKRQMLVQAANCMKKRMAADKLISYSAAAKVCKNQVSNQSDNVVSVAVEASDFPARP